ncbi:Putative HTH-type transcriptional regulator YwnA [Ascidiaceihabitans donghaensis]|uniref:HTH-type transcriptional regulator YwnA n=2 Tax=Ascidiaceihabitans donghaensis TaxID=1510460 RepID=A0A2R8BH79_9RHOB|nr:Putative HTH-type transcriptional regulator YwnA [Ascidiaceihabitans donghaensis]
MAMTPTKMRTSASIAEHSGTNAVVVRRVLGTLKDAGLLSSEKGHAGGWRLARKPEDISLADVYLALGESLVASKVAPNSSDCSLEDTLQNKVADVLQDVEKQLVLQLNQTSILDIANTR